MNEKAKIFYHYTSMEGLLGIIESKSIWATNVLYLNDASELNYSMELLKEQLMRYQKEELQNASVSKILFFEREMNYMDDFLFPDIFGFFVCSFSEEKDLLSQWRGYSSGGIGFSLGFKFNKLMECKQGRLRPCIYDERKQINEVRKIIKRMSDLYDNEFGNQKIDYKKLNKEIAKKLIRLGMNYSQDIIELAPFIKHPKFKEEKEWRIIVMVSPWDEINIRFRSGQSMIVPYIDFPLPNEGDNLVINEIVVGPTNEPRLSRASVKMLLVSRNVKFDEIQYSTIPYRNW